MVGLAGSTGLDRARGDIAARFAIPPELNITANSLR